MVEPRRRLHAGQVRGVDRPEGAQAVGDHRHDQRGDHEADPPPPRHETDVGDEHAEREHRDDELRARTRLRHLEIIAAGVDQHAVRRGGHAEQVEERHDDPHRHRLQRRLERLAEGDEEQRIGQREQQPARDLRAKQRHHRALQHQHHTQLPREADRTRIAHQPAGAPRRDEQQPRPPGRRRQGTKLAPPLPDQPADHRPDEQAMPEGRAGPPDRDEPHDIGAEHQQDECNSQRQRDPVPPPAAHAPSPSRSSSGASRAAQS